MSKNIKNENIDLDARINLAYDYLYNSEKNDCYAMKPVTKNDLKVLSNIKQEYNEKVVENILNKILNNKFKFIQNGGNSVSLKRYSDKSHPSHVKISTYNKSYSKDTLETSDNMDKVIKYLFASHFPRNKHIIFPILNFDVSINQKNVMSFVKNNKDKFSNILEDLKGGNIDENLSFEITEHFYKKSSLKKYLKNNKNKLSEEDLKTIVFQVVHTLSEIQDKFNGFRHNNLDTSTLNVYMKKKNNGYSSYKTNNNIYNVPNGDIDIKIGNFNKSTIVNFFENKSLSKSHNKKDLSFDVINFINSLRKELPNNYKEFNNFVDRVNKNKLTPFEILENDNYFKNLKGGSNTEDSDSEYVIERYGNKNDSYGGSDNESSSFTVGTLSDSESESNVFVENTNEITSKRTLLNKLDNVKMTHVINEDELSGGSDSENIVTKRNLRSGLTDSEKNVNKSEDSVGGSISENEFVTNKIGSILGATKEEIMMKDNNGMKNENLNQFGNVLGGINNVGNVNQMSTYHDYIKQGMPNSNITDVNSQNTVKSLPLQMSNNINQFLENQNINQPGLSEEILQKMQSVPQNMNQMQGIPQIPDISQMQSMPQMQELSQMQGMPQMQGIPQMQGMQQMPGMQGIPQMPGMQGMQGIPSNLSQYMDNSIRNINEISDHKLKEMDIDMNSLQMPNSQNMPIASTNQLDLNQINNIKNSLPKEFSGILPDNIQSQLPDIQQFQFGGSKKKI